MGFGSNQFARAAGAVCTLGMVFMTTACSAHKAVPLGTIPLVEQPQPHSLRQTAQAIAYKESKRGRKLHQGCKHYKRTKKILDRLTDSIGAPRDTWPLYMVNAGEETNAFAANQNTIVVYEALVLKTSDEELATVMAHEIAHILAKHGRDENEGTKKTVLAVGARLAGYAAAIGSAYAGANASAAGNLGSLAANTTGMIGQGMILEFDRDQEREADEIGLMIMAKAGYDPRTAVSFWKRAKEVFGSGNNLSFFSTHPSNDSRAKDLKKALPAALQYFEESTKQELAKTN